MRAKLTPEVDESIRVECEDSGVTLSTRDDLRRGTAYNARPALSKANLGEASRQIIAARMMLAGLSVFRPLAEDTSVDLLVLRNDGVALKCQCKSMYVARNGVHAMNLFTVRKWGPNAKAVKHRYTADEVDFFLGYAVETDSIYVFPFEATGQFKTVLYVWILRQPTNNNGTTRFDTAPYKNAFHLLSS